MKINPQFKKLVCEDEILALKMSLTKLLPSSGQMLNIVNIGIQKRFSKATKVDFYLYVENENLELALVEPFVVCIQQQNIHSMYCMNIQAPKDPTPQMMNVFENLVEWDKLHLLSAVNQQFYTNHLKSLCLKHGGFKTTDPDGLPCEAYAMDPKLAVDFVCPDLSSPGNNVEVKELSVTDSEEIIRNYPEWTKPHTKFIIEETIRYMTSCGVYVNSQLASSGVFSPVGLINIVYTDKAYRRRGYGVTVMKELGKYISSLGFIPMAECTVWNDSSRELQKKSGFKFVGYTNWVRFKE